MTKPDVFHRIAERAARARGGSGLEVDDVARLMRLMYAKGAFDGAVKERNYRMSLQQGDQEAAAVAVAPRVSLADMEAEIAQTFYATGELAIGINVPDVPPSLKVLTLCFLVMKNGYTLVGKSAPADARNFDPALGRKFAREDAVRQLWPLMGYALRERLAAEAKPKSDA